MLPFKMFTVILIWGLELDEEKFLPFGTFPKFLLSISEKQFWRNLKFPIFILKVLPSLALKLKR